MNTAVFIDFQGTIGGSGTDDIRTLELFLFTLQAIKLLNDCGYLVMGITNQSHISKDYIIGDMGMSDMLLAKNVNAKGILVLTGVGKGSLKEYRHTCVDYEPYHIAEDMLEAVYFIIKD